MATCFNCNSSIEPSHVHLVQFGALELIACSECSSKLGGPSFTEGRAQGWREALEAVTNGLNKSWDPVCYYRCHDEFRRILKEVEQGPPEETK